MENFENISENVLPEKVQRAFDEYESSVLEFIKRQEDEIRNGVEKVWQPKFFEYKTYQKEIFANKMYEACKEDQCEKSIRFMLDLKDNQKISKEQIAYLLTERGYSDKFRNEIKRIKNSSV